MQAEYEEYTMGGSDRAKEAGNLDSLTREYHSYYAERARKN
jgi:hypothetical protein